jgi:hypothetical protein
MKKIIIIAAAAVVVLATAAYSIYSVVMEKPLVQNPAPVVTGKLSEAEARSIAEQTCIKGGEALSGGSYNDNSKTWWFDANLNATREGCNPACVVSEDTKQAEINWRCTGLVQPPPTGLKTVTDDKQGITYSYPNYLYELSTGEFAPKVTISKAKIVCHVGYSNGIETTEQTINNKKYCVSVESDGAAGTMYSNYTYTTSLGDKIEKLTFVIRTTNCDVYGDAGADYDNCIKDNASFNANDVANQILSSVEFK